MKNKSYWSSSVEFKDYPRLENDVTVDAAIIGGGIAGFNIAYMLKKSGLKVAIIDSGKIAHGNTANTTAKITLQHDLCYNRLITEHGEKKALQYAKANEEALEMYEKIITQNDIACDFRKVDSIIFSVTDKGKEDIIKEYEASPSCGKNSFADDIGSNLEVSYNSSNSLFPVVIKSFITMAETID